MALNLAQKLCRRLLPFSPVRDLELTEVRRQNRLGLGYQPQLSHPLTSQIPSPTVAHCPSCCPLSSLLSLLRISAHSAYICIAPMSLPPPIATSQNVPIVFTLCLVTVTHTHTSPPDLLLPHSTRQRPVACIAGPLIQEGRGVPGLASSARQHPGQRRCASVAYPVWMDE